MARRNGKKAADDFRVGPGEPVDTYESAAAAAATARPDAPPASIEARMAHLESILGEKDRLIRHQAAAIALGIEHAERLRKSRERVMHAERRADEAKKAAGEAKKAHEAAVAEHFDLERDLDSPQGRLPFPAEPDEPEEAGADAWRGVILDTLDLSPSTIARLFEANLATVGELCDYLTPGASGSCRRLQDIPGVGAAKVEEIEHALDRFWEAQASPVSSAAADANAEILAGVREVEAERDAMNGEVYDGEYEEDEA